MDCPSSSDSSDSIEDHLVDPSKINFDSSFFKEKTIKRRKRQVKTKVKQSKSSDDDELDVPEPANTVRFSKILQNLEISNNLLAKSTVEEGPCCSKQAEKKELADSRAISDEITELLLRGETHIGDCKEESEDDENDIEKTEENERPAEYTIPKDGIQITVSGQIALNKKKKGGTDLKAMLRKRIRATQLLVEKAALLCWLAYGFYLNRLASDTEIMCGSLSLVSQSNYPKNRVDLSYLLKFTKWFKSQFVIEIGDAFNKLNQEVLMNRLEGKKITDSREIVLLYIATLRALGLHCRLIVSLCPPAKKMPEILLSKSDAKAQNTKSETKSENKVSEKLKSRMKKSSEKVVKSANRNAVPENSAEAKRNANAEAKRRAAEILQTQPKATKRPRVTTKERDKKEETERTMSVRQLRSRTANANSKTTNNVQKVKFNESESESDYDPEEEEEEQELDEEVSRVVRRPARGKFKSTNKGVKEAVINKEATTILKGAKKSRKLVSSDEEEDEDESSTRKTEDIWAEVYLESEESWICVSVMEEKVHCIEDVYKKAKKPVLYVIAWNAEGLIKDVTRRYCKHWLTETRKKRIDEKWWLETLSPWKERNTIMSRTEDEMLLQKDLEQPLPTTISECKGHPLYVLQRHLLKFEALYPPDCVPLGHLKTGEAIYSRHCVHTLCSRETWLKKARVVKPQQEPYKIVKARPKYDKLTGMSVKDTPLEVFGEWQTTEYEPPVAKDGIVPRNEYGNVDLFKECMLPKGTVHINLPGLNRIARKLDIDCAPAVVGFNFGRMGAAPDFCGFVVCEEYEDTLREAWEAEQIEAAKREREKRDKRVYGNWKKLIRGLLIRERLAAKYDFTEETPAQQSNKRPKQTNKISNVKKSRDS